MNICVYGAASQQIHTEYLQAAENLGKLLAENGFGLVFGGGDTGVMGACARGASQAGGSILGIAPRFFDREGVLYKGCTEFLFTDTMRQRKELMEQRSNAFVMAPGGIGTLEEFFEILTLKQLGRHEKPIYILNIRGYYDNLGALLENAVREGFLEKGGLNLFQMYRDPRELVQELKETLK